MLIADRPEQLQAMLDVVSNYAHKWRFRMNTASGKSNVAVIGPERRTKISKWFLSGEELKRVQEYKYLGVETGKTAGRWNTYLERI